MRMHCLLCSYKNRYPHYHRISMWFMLLERFCNTEQRCRPDSRTETRGITQRHRDQVYVCIVHCCLCQNRIQHFHHMSTWFFLERCCNIHCRTASTSSQRTGNTWYPTPWPRVVMHCIRMFVSNSIYTFRSHVHVPVGWALLHYRTARLTVVCMKINIHIPIAQHTVLRQRVVMHC